MKSILSKALLLFIVISCAICVNAQSTKRIYRDAEAYNFKGHVKKAVTYSTAAKGGSREKIEEVEFLPNGCIDVKGMSGLSVVYIARDKKKRLARFCMSEIDLSPSGDWVEGIGRPIPYEIASKIDKRDFYIVADLWEYYEFHLESKDDVYNCLEKSKYDSYIISEERVVRGFEWAKNNKVKKRVGAYVHNILQWDRGVNRWNFLNGGCGDVAYIYSYDANGNIVKTMVEYKITKSLYATYTYLKFDSKGNWIKRKAKSSDGKTTIETRTITYYK